MNLFVIIYLTAISVFAVIITVFDKARAVRGGRRVRENILLSVSMLGGSVAMYLTMRFIRHKTKKKKFMLGIPLIFLLQIGICCIIWRVMYAASA